MAVNKFKCPFCSKIYVQKPALYEHMDKIHHKDLQGLSPAHYYFNKRNKKTGGKCVICGRPTEFNETTERYERFDRQVCRDKYRDEFKKRMTKKYGSVNALMNDPQHQKQMLANRRISGTYKWSTGGSSIYTGTYELDFLKYCDLVLGLKSTDVVAPAPQVFPYKYQGKTHQYIPDFWVVPFNIVVEIKGSNKHYRDRDINKEYAKDAQMEKQDCYYIKIVDKKYDDFVNLIQQVKNADNDNRMKTI